MDQNLTFGDQRLDMIMWVVFGIVGLISLVKLINIWAWVSETEVKRKPSWISALCVTGLFISAVGLTFTSSGPKASNSPIEINAPADRAKIEFVDQVNKDAEKVKPISTNQLIKDRAARKKARNEKVKKDFEKDEADGFDSMKEFRKSILNRNKSKETEKK